MNIVSAENLSLSFADKSLFNKITFGVLKGQRIALVGVNGSGKTTLLRVLAGEEKHDQGDVQINKQVYWEYLPQDPYYQPDTTVFNALLDTEVLQVKALKNYLKLLEDPNQNADAFSDAIDAMNQNDAWQIETQMKQLLSLFGIKDLEQKMGSLSGGQRKRVALAAMLLRDADFYMLDEPTNHLDLEAIEWIERFLIQKNKTCLFITHDRYFLEQVATDIYELDQGQIFTYPGKYADFLENKALRYEQLATTVDKAQNLLRKELEWMRRQPKARGTKSKARIDAYYDLEKVANQETQQQGLSLNFKASRQGKKVLELHRICFKFGDKTIINPFSYTFKRQEKIGIVGKNGTGKTTFLNLIMGQLQPHSGHIDWGETAEIAYYSQHNPSYNAGTKLIDVVKQIAEIIEMDDGSKLTASQFLNLFLFSPSRQQTPVEKLSGGEKRRLFLCTLLIRRPNFLIFDEPTNDLDLLTLNVLEAYLESFAGSVILVSHDRYFLDKLCDQLFVFEGEGEISIFTGNYSDYRQSLAQVSAETPKSQAIVQAKINQIEDKSTPKNEKNKLSFKELKTLQALEKEIEALEQEKNKLLQALQNEHNTAIEIRTLSDTYTDVEKTLEEKTFQWLELTEKAES